MDAIHKEIVERIAQAELGNVTNQTIVEVPQGKLGGWVEALKRNYGPDSSYGLAENTNAPGRGGIVYQLKQRRRASITVYFTGNTVFTGVPAITASDITKADFQSFEKLHGEAKAEPDQGGEEF